jgi:uncharacterized protein YbbK (DUF523 family)
MSRNSHSTSKHSRSDATREIEIAIANEPTGDSETAASITSAVLYKTSPSSGDHHTLLAEAAYRRAEQRGFAAGHELEDWLAAEAEMNQRLAGDGRAY